MKSRAFTLIEMVVCVVVLGIAVPPTLELVADAAAGRADSVNTTRAVLFAELVLETCIADVASNSDGLGFAGLGDSSAYETGLRSRLADVQAAYTDVGMSFDLSVGSLVSSAGSVSENEIENVFRVITVTVEFQSARGSAQRLPVSMVIGEL
ncbi:MAG: prepilin-type N-terminal cleavage/methylation domain-containing protein [Phycisphaerales bacterium]